MSKIDKELLERKLETLRDNRQKLEGFRSFKRETYLTDPVQYGATEYHLQHALEAIIDICRLLAISLELKATDEAQSLFAQLFTQGVFTKEFVDKNAKMVGLRNILVHEYAEIDHAKTYDVLQNHLEDFDEFVRQVSGYIKSSDKR